MFQFYGTFLGKCQDGYAGAHRQRHGADPQLLMQELTEEPARRLHRLGRGGFADELLLGGQRVPPNKAL
nr:hypothetical protein [Bradyrhizobium vignae]